MKKITKFAIKTMMDYLIHTQGATKQKHLIDNLKQNYFIEDSDNIDKMIREILLEGENMYNYQINTVDGDLEYDFTLDNDIVFNYGYAENIKILPKINNEDIYLKEEDITGSNIDSKKLEEIDKKVDGDLEKDFPNNPTVYPDGTKVYFRNEVYHREDGPAIIYNNDCKLWYKNGKLHREDGPAIEWLNNQKYYYLEGVEYNETYYYDKVNDYIIPTNTQEQYNREPKQILYVINDVLIDNETIDNNDWVVYHKDKDDEFHIYDKNLNRNKVRSKYATILGYHMKDIRSRRYKNMNVCTQIKKA